MSIDFWYFCFRILNSYNYIQTDIQIQKYLDYINELIIKNLNNNKDNNIEVNWISFIINNLAKIKNCNYSTVYDYINLIVY